MPRHPEPIVRPLVAVTASSRADDGVERVRLNTLYTRAVERVGLTPMVIVPPEATNPDDPAVRASAEAIMNVAHGLVLTGGEDIDPAYFHAARSPYLETVHARRDAIEIALIRLAQQRAIPTLAICRGIQVLNVALGGTLIQDIPHERPNALNHSSEGKRAERTHAIRVEPDTRLAELLHGTAFEVNSVHHQSVDRVAPSLRITATSPDGVVEGIETFAHEPWWAVGVQWHPEEFLGAPHAPDLGLFAAFRDAIITPPTARRHAPAASRDLVNSR